MLFEYSKLLGRIREICGSQSKFSRAMDISERSLSCKINGKIGWKQKEIVKACNILGIDKIDIPEYFFNIKAQNIEHSESA